MNTINLGGLKTPILEVQLFNFGWCVFQQLVIKQCAKFIASFEVRNLLYRIQRILVNATPL